MEPSTPTLKKSRRQQQQDSEIMSIKKPKVKKTDVSPVDEKSDNESICSVALSVKQSRLIQKKKHLYLDLLSMLEPSDVYDDEEKFSWVLEWLRHEICS